MSRRGLLLAGVLLVTLTGCGSRPTPPVAPDPTTGASLANGAFRLPAGVEHDVCGIGVVFGVLPGNALTSKLDFPVLFGGPVGHVDTVTGDATGQDSLPANAVGLRHGVVVTVAGQRFGVNEIDLAARTVTLTPLC